MNPLPLYLGLLSILLGALAMHAGLKDRRATIAVGGFLFVLTGGGLIVLAFAMAR